MDGGTCDASRVEAEDRLHVMVREEVAEEMDDLLERWRDGPVGLPPRTRPRLRSGASVFSTRPAARLTQADQAE